VGRVFGDDATAGGDGVVGFGPVEPGHGGRRETSNRDDGEP
jgi:hypothetical protein